MSDAHLLRQIDGGPDARGPAHAAPTTWRRPERFPGGLVIPALLLEPIERECEFFRNEL